MMLKYIFLPLFNRNQELEIEVARLKSKIVDSDDPAHLEVTRKEINKMMAELKRKMQIQFESQSTTDKELRAKELKQLEDYRVKVIVSDKQTKIECTTCNAFISPVGLK